MRGKIICQKCSNVVTPVGRSESVTCQHCGYLHVYIRFKHHGKAYRFFRGKDGRQYLYETAINDLIDINREIKAGEFNPDAWTGAANIRTFAKLWQEWYDRKEKKAEEDEFSVETLVMLRGYFKHYFKPWHNTEMKAFASMAKREMQQFYDTLPERSPKGICGAKTKKNIMDALHSFLNWVRDWERPLLPELPPWPEMDKIVEVPRKILNPYHGQADVLSEIPEEHRDTSSSCAIPDFAQVKAVP